MASCDLGDLGPSEGEPITYYWSPLNHLSGLLPWLLLGIAFIVFKENRRTAALWMLLPVMVSALAWSGLAHLLGMPSSLTAMFNPVVYSLLIALALIWLLGERIGRRHRLLTWLLALLIFAAVAGLLLLDIGLGSMAMQVLTFLGLMTAVLLLSFVIAGLWSRKKPGPVRFVFKCSLCILLTTTILIFTLVTLQFISGSIPIPFKTIILQVLISGLACAGVLIALLLPMELLLMIHPFWRERFEAVMGIPTRRPPIPEEPQETSPAGEQCSQESAP